MSKSNKHPPLSVHYKPTRWDTRDRDGNPVPRVVFVCRAYTEYRDPSGRTFVQRH